MVPRIRSPLSPRVLKKSPEQIVLRRGIPSLLCMFRNQTLKNSFETPFQEEECTPSLFLDLIFSTCYWLFFDQLCLDI